MQIPSVEAASTARLEDNKAVLYLNPNYYKAIYYLWWQLTTVFNVVPENIVWTLPKPHST